MRSPIRTALMLAVALFLIAAPGLCDRPWSTYTIEPPDGERFDGFGRALAVDPSNLLVASPGHNVPQESAGVVYVFRKDNPGRSWELSTTIPPVRGRENDIFGAALAMTSSGLLVGSPGEDSGGVLNSGAIHVFRNVGDAWLVADTVRPNNALEGSGFGSTLAVGNGWFAAGTPRDYEHGFHAGAVRIFVFDEEVGKWIEGDKLAESEPIPVSSFGSSVAVAGNILAVGARGSITGDNKGGRAYVFRRSPNGELSEEQELFAPVPPLPGDAFGIAVATNGRYVAVASIEPAVYIYEFARGAWRHVQRIIPDAADSTNRGVWPTFSEKLLVISDPSWNAHRGAVRIYSLRGNRWRETRSLENTGSVTQFGFPALIGHGELIVGERFGHSEASDESGTAEVIRLPGRR